MSGRPIKILARGMQFEISDDADGERYTFGTLWVDKKYRAALIHEAANPFIWDGKRETPVYEVYVLNHYYRFQGFNVSKPEYDSKTKCVKVGFSSEDLIAVGDIKATAQITK